ncbi:UDP-N-acetyl-D-glucosamine dehydrogenase [bacterium (Candidatus Gribaldobacteria) CG23_combo_of_CG06-09_8_20_14_all_37_87_8]|uniref:UDP-N-acetyl-D-glucosamine dehydrogenase n=1 Tax=bacterium (Candidatus Gribaldobacteria) CG23_combo_of_CG06-09_8_20_14_all_37_87_8 TaxID=2014278 RepID=A0A2G9ZEC8_9BACT|nr:MAG: UDP-N-acetyl-D-glucosamine dehydrogenase [bacterium (Candidatus Gribaldobacteria) CG23_combo_of_CG06-09_8_20_14_all_37_87_8]
MNKDKSVAIIGLGYVGLPLAILASEKGWKVFGIDILQKKVDLIKSRKSPFVDEEVEVKLKITAMEATTDFEKVKEVSVIVICVPTPVFENRLPDYGPVESACKGIGQYLQKGQLVVLESTVNPGVCEEIVIPILEKESGLKAGVDFYVAHCPERINPGDKNWNVSNISRVAGGLDKTSLERALDFYGSVISAPIRPMGSLKEAEAVKVVENSFRNVNIAFVNELAESFARMGIDVVNVINGAATKPFAFMPHYPGCGIGGHCIPVDPYYLIDYARKNYGFEHKLLELACKTNEAMPEYTAELVEKGLKEKGKDIKGARVAVLGLAYKAGIGDCRESPSFELIKVLKDKGAQVIAYDPYVSEKSDVSSVDEALNNSEAVVIATDHALFRALRGYELAKHGVKVVVDGRNCLDKLEIQSAGLIYAGIGR